MSNIDRREFLKLVGSGSAGLGGGFLLAESIKHPVEHLIPAVVPPEDFSPGIATWYNSVCSMCEAGCGISVRTREGRAKKIEGNPSHPVSQGRLCALGQAGLQVLYNPDRLTAPMMRSDSRKTGALSESNWEQTTWEDGLTKVVQRLGGLKKTDEGNRICFLSKGLRGSLANLVELFMTQLGSERLLHYDFSHPHSLFAANKHFFGEDVLPYYDLENAHYVLSFGADYLGSWISPVHHSLAYGRSRQGKGELRGRFVQIEPRMSISGAAADEWIAAKPGTEGILALGLAHHIVINGFYQGEDRDSWLESLNPFSTERVAALTGVSEATLSRLGHTFATSGHSLAIGGGNAGSHSNGMDTMIAINALNYLVGNLGQPGGVVFNPSPVVGSDSHTLPHARQANYHRMLEFIDEAREGKIEVLILNNTNPVFTLPLATRFQEALENIPLIVSLSSFMDESTAMADLILPSHTYLESWGDDFPEPGVGFPVGSVSQPVVSPLYNTKATGDILLAIAKKLELSEAMPWANMKEFLEAKWLEIFRQRSPGAGMGDFQTFWTEVLKAGVWGQKTGSEYKPFTLERSLIRGIKVAAPVFTGDSDNYPFILHPYLSTALHDGRGANLPWIQELPDAMTSVVYGSWLEVNPVTANRLGLSEGDLVSVESPHGKLRVPVLIYPAILPNVIAMPVGQGHVHYGRYAKNRGSNPLQILAPQMDTESGSLAWGSTRVKLVTTGKKANVVKTGGLSRDLGREIIRTTPSKPNIIVTKEV